MLAGRLEEDFKRSPDARASNPSAYHITNEQNLENLFASGFLYCDSYVRNQGVDHIVIGYDHTKDNRLGELIPIADNLRTGDCVPFNYSPRSVMLYVVYRATDARLATRYGENPVVHLRFNVGKVVDWAKSMNLRVFFTNANAASSIAEVFDDVRSLDQFHWDDITANDWREGTVRTFKAAELLVENRVSLELLEEIGVKNEMHRSFVNDIILKYPKYQGVPVTVHPDWYYGASR